MSEYERWETRFAGADYALGTAPNAFLASCGSVLPASGRALAVADGRALLEEAFLGYGDMRIVQEDVEVREGASHAGLSAVINFTARKPHRPH